MATQVFISKPQRFQAFQVTLELVASHIFDKQELPKPIYLNNWQVDNGKRIIRSVVVRCSNWWGRDLQIGDWVVWDDINNPHVMSDKEFKSKFDPEV